MLIKYNTPLRFQPVNNTNTSNPQEKVNKTAINTNYNLNDPSSNFNKSLIKFTGYQTSYDDTLKRNYFNLPINSETNEPFKPDLYQTAAAENLYKGNDVIVAAPTGTGKTAIAHYIITKNLNEGKKTFYTAPLKALSNDKIREFNKIYGEENVGLLTGDRKVNTNAPIVIMTTEVYRNMIMQDKLNNHNPVLDDLKTVIFDEMHYLNDEDRGTVWEQSILFTKPETQILGLSGTMKNADVLTDWVASTKGRNTSEKVTPKDNYKALNLAKPHTVLINVPSEYRHVPLEFKVEKLNQKGKSKVNCHRKLKKAKNTNADKMTPDSGDYSKMIDKLKKEDKLPAIFFVFSKKKSRELLQDMKLRGANLTTKQEKLEIYNTIREAEENGTYFGELLDKEALIKGYAIHNAGMLPEQKELVEKLFQKKLVKAAFATETLSAGINMPARTTIISSVTKPVSKNIIPDGIRKLTPNEFHQMGGRAGRRGIDKIGYVYCMACNDKQAQDFNTLIQTQSNDVESKFKTDYSFIANMNKKHNSHDFLHEFFEKSLYAYDKDPQKRKQNAKDLEEEFNKKENILKKNGFINKDNTLTKKGELLTHINGYEQIPVINEIFDKKLQGLNPQQLAGYVAGLANLSKEPVRLTKDDTKEFEDDTLEKMAISLNQTMYGYENTIYDEKDKAYLNENAMKHVYKWADMNSKNEESTDNWHDMLVGDNAFNIKDEGSLFKEIVMTTDLLKQINDIAKTGEENASDESDKNYYKNLKSTAKDAVDLIDRTPAKQNE